MYVVLKWQVYLSFECIKKFFAVFSYEINFGSDLGDTFTEIHIYSLRQLLEN